MSIDHEPEGLGGVFVAHRAQLRGVAQKITGQRELAEDVVQEAYLKLSGAASAFSIQQPLAYCFQVVRNLAIDCRRRLALESTVFADEEDGLHVPAAQGTPDEYAISRQNLQIVDRVLAGLPARTRQAFELYRVGGLTQRAIGEQLGVSAALVNSMIRDATQALSGCRHLLARG
ncbi:sigma-70 family RNA polymerase sigma factor [Eleftheria terrae]|uniref:sigma-70 family RNA polymerase sigma factor n=1 Tax=Eleftheria terrae TaxID=1597781 RepID=UPI00263AC4B1|nr:sigma-70 family RNA polymerase sigma factor [Eleftheria terrae]WKB55463.1 sigma-70 family RNA polymerase sigma factor [Eleftheria terrae]